MYKSSNTSSKSRKTKIIVIMPAHNAEKTLVESYKKLPKEYIDEVILVDDASTDDTYNVAKKMPIKVFQNSINLGYGGNLKVCLTKALESGADVIIEYHPDNQYDPKNLPLLIQKAKEGYDFALGSRFIHPKEALYNKMPFVKFVANRLMSFIDTFILGIELSELHSGFRMYTKKMLTTISYLQNSDDYLFSFEVIVQAVYKHMRIAEVPISCKYHKEMHTASIRRSTIYAIGTFKTLFQYITSKFIHMPNGPFKEVVSATCPYCNDSITRLEAKVVDSVSKEEFSIYYCSICQLGSTHPTPRSTGKYYPRTYYMELKTILYNIFQFRRPAIIKQYKQSGRILDIGCGDGSLGKHLGDFMYTGIEAPFSDVRNRNVKAVGIEGMKEAENSYDVVTFWESLEHIKDPKGAIQKSYTALKKGGLLIVECPDFTSSERLIFGTRWFHLDPPRHIVHFTPKGIANLFKTSGFSLVDQYQVYAPEYAPIGLCQSIIYLFFPGTTFVAQKNKSAAGGMLAAFTIFLLLPITIPLSLLLFPFHGSPVFVTVAKKL